MRRQPSTRLSNGKLKFGRVVEQLCLPKGRYRLVYRAWFSEAFTLHYKAMAVLLFIRAGTGKGEGVFPREVAKRFEWSSSTVSKLLVTLERLGLIVAVELPRPGGRFAGRYYIGSETARRSTTKRPATEASGIGVSDGIHIESPETSIKAASPFHVSTTVPTPNEEVVPALPEPPLTLAQLKSEAMSRAVLLGWMKDSKLAAIATVTFDDDDLRESYRAISDQDLLCQLVAATGGRCSPDLLSPAGLCSLRMLAAAFVQSAPSVAAAIPTVLDAIASRIGDRPNARLSSFAVIGMRLAATAIGSIGSDHALAASRSKGGSSAGTADRQPVGHDLVLTSIRGASGASLIHPKLFMRTAHLAKQVEAYGQDLVIETVRAILARCLLDGKQVNAWSYFDGPLRDAAETSRNHEGQFDPNRFRGGGPGAPPDIPF